MNFKISRIFLGIGAAALFAVTSALAVTHKVLHYYKVGYYNHTEGIKGGRIALDSLSKRYGFTVTHSANESDMLNLKNYDLVVFDNNTDAGFDVTSNTTPTKQALIDYMNNGGKYLGFHAASDHQDHWNWYDTALFSGAKFDGHDGGGFNVNLDTTALTMGDAALMRMRAYSTDSLKLKHDSKTPINMNTEQYYFNNEVRGQPNVKVLEFTNRIGNGNKVSFVWTKKWPVGTGRMLYTALGHQEDDWTQNDRWLTMQTYAYMKYLWGDFDNVVSIVPTQKPGISVRGSLVEILTTKNHTVKISDVNGKVISTGSGATHSHFNLKQGIYIVSVNSASGLISQTVFIH